MNNFEKKIIDNLPYGYISCDDKFNIVYANKAANKILNLNICEFNIFDYNFDWFNPRNQKIAIENHPVYQCLSQNIEINDVALGFSNNTDNIVYWLDAHFIPDYDNDNKEIKYINITFSKSSINKNIDINKIVNQKSNTASLAVNPIQDELNDKLLDSELSFRNLFKTNPQPMWVYDVETLHFLAVNNSAIDKYGYSREEFLNMTLKDIRPKEDIEKLLKDVESTNSELNHAGEWIHKKKNGELINVEIVSHSVVFNGRNARHVLINDITELKLITEKKHEVDILFKTLVEKSSEAITIVNELGIAIYVSPIAFQMLGYSEEEFYSMRYSDVVHPDDYDIIEQAFFKVIEAPGNEVKLFGRQRQKSGNYIWTEGVATNWLHDPHIKGIVVNFRDITDRIQKEDSLNKRELLLNEMGRIANIGGWELDCITMKQAWTDETYIIHDRDKDIYNPNAEEELSKFSPGSKEKIEKAFDLAFNKGEPYDLEVEMTTVVGNKKWVRAVCSPIIKDGKVVKLTGTVQDITVQKKVENELKQSNIRFLTMFRSNPTPSGITRVSDFRIIDVNDAWCKLTGYSREEVLNLNSTELGIAKAETLNRIRDILNKNNSINQTELIIYTRSREERIVLLNSEIIEVSGEKYILNNLLDITERKTAEINLANLAERLNLATQSASIGIWDWDIQNNVLKWDEQMYSLYGLNQGEFKGAYEAWLNGLHPDDREISNRTTQNALLELSKYDTEFRIVWQDNTIHWLKADGLVIRDENGTAVRMLGVNYDITERKVAEERLRESELKLKLFVEHAPAAIAMFDKDMNYIAASRRFVNDYKIQEKDLVGKSHYDVFPEIGDDWKAIHNRCLAGAIEKNEEDIFPREDGSIDWVRWEIHPWFDSQNNIGGIVLFSELISERKKAELIIKESEERYRSLFEVSPDAIFINVDNRIELVNDSCLKLFGANKKEDLIGKTPFDLFHPDYHHLIKKRIEKMFLTNSSSPLMEEKVIRLDGKVIDVEVTANTFNLNGKTAINVILRDITERLTSQEIIKKSEENYRRLFYDSPVGYLVIKNGVFVDCNNASIELIGGDREYLIGKSPAELSPELQPNGRNSIEYANELIGIALINSRNSFEWTQLKADGTPFVSQVDLSIMSQSDELIILVSWQDITEKFNTLNNLKESEERFRNLFERMTQGVVYQNSDGYITAANDAAQEMLGLSLDQLQGRTSFAPEWRSIKEDGSEFPGNEHPAMITLNTGKPLKDVIMGVYHPKDESYRWLLIHTTPVFKYNSTTAVAVFTIFDDITEKRRIAKEKQESEVLFKTIFNSFNSNLFILDESGKILNLNETLIRKYGIVKDEIKGKFIQELPWWKHEKYDYSAFINNAILKVNNGIAISEEFSFIDELGKISYYDISLIPIWNENAEINKILFESRDVSELRHQEESARILDRMFQKSASGVVIADARQKDFPIIDLNDAFTSITGYQKHEVLGKNCRFLQGENRDENSSNIIREAIKEGKECRVELLNYKKSGELFWNELYLAPVHNNLGELTHYVGIQNDITSRKLEHFELESYRNRLEELVAVRTKQLEINQDKLLKTQQMVKLGSWEFDVENGNVNWTNEIYNIFNRDSKQNPYNFAEFVNTVIEEDLKQFFEFVELTRKEPKINSKTFRHKTETGNILYLEHNVETEFNNGEPVFIVGSIQDVTIQKLTELELNKAVKLAEDANKSKSEFLANMSHEIRTPLNSIIGFSELLYNNVKDEKSRSQLEAIRKSGKTLLNIINDILDLSKVEAGKIIIENEPLNVFQLVKDVCQMFEHNLKEKNLNLTIELLSELNSRIMLDETRLRQILFNLIGNAIKFTEIGGIDIFINHIEKQNNKVDLFINVIDTGMGIPQEQLTTIFEPFVQQQDQENKKFGGTGLGLAISRRLAEAMGGKIEVKSEVNKGSEFSIIISDLEYAVQTDENNSNTKGLEANVRLNGNSILIVDDIKDNRILLKDILENSNAIIFEAENGMDAIKIAKQNIPDVILMDIRMPIMDGIETTKIIKSFPETSLIPCIAITASIRYGSNDPWIKELFVDYLTKPIDFNKLYEVLNKYLVPSESIHDTNLFYGKNNSKTIENEIPIDNSIDSELIKFVLNDLQEMFMKVTNSHLIDEIEDFAIKLRETGEKYKNDYLLELGTNLNKQVYLFDIEKINKLLLEFKHFINIIRG